jgi:hypothetical protein
MTVTEDFTDLTSRYRGELLAQVSQAFLPALTRSRGTIVNNLSLAALAPVPFERQNAALLPAAGSGPRSRGRPVTAAWAASGSARWRPACRPRPRRPARPGCAS